MYVYVSNLCMYSTKCHWEHTVRTSSANFCTRLQSKISANLHPNHKRSSLNFSGSKIWIPYIGKLTGDYLANGDRWGKHCYSQQTSSLIWTFDWHIYIWPWPVLTIKAKVMHILIVNISETVKDRTSIAIGNKNEVACGLSISILHLILAYSRGELGCWNGMSPNIVVNFVPYTIVWAHLCVFLCKYAFAWMHMCMHTFMRACVQFLVGGPHKTISDRSDIFWLNCGSDFGFIPTVTSLPW